MGTTISAHGVELIDLTVRRFEDFGVIKIKVVNDTNETTNIDLFVSLSDIEALLNGMGYDIAVNAAE